MKIHEYQAKELLAAAGAAVPPASSSRRRPRRSRPSTSSAARWCSRPRSTPAAAARARSRAAARITAASSSSRPAPRPARSPRPCSNTPSSRSRPARTGQKVSKVLVVNAAAKIAKEYYVGVVLDRSIGLPVVMASAEGGVEIEEVAAKHPEKILKRSFDPDAGLHPFQTRRKDPKRPSTPTRGCTRSRPGGWPTNSASPASRRPRPRRSSRPWRRSFSTRIAAWPRSTRW